MKKLKQILIFGVMAMFIVACGGSDEPDNLNRRYDWDVIETVLIRKTGEHTQTKYIVYDKTDEYMRQQKMSFESQSDKYHGYLYIYTKRD